ncbi:MAG: tRNA epoxyqueuosine(34) reductase QueG [Pirellulales bacterium]
MNTTQLTSILKEAARDEGFALTGVCPAVAPAGWSRFEAWLRAGYAGEMRYLIDRADAYCHPRSVLDGVRSIVMLGMEYRTVKPAEATAGRGRVSCYAWGDTDYHDWIHPRLRALVRRFRELVPGAAVRGVVDTAPLLEREFARLAGLGWIGKNTLLINRQSGSWFFLAALLTNVELDYDPPHALDHCGTCRACLDACPTDAFPEPYVLDARRCISYLTIEQRGHVPRPMRRGVGNWLFGCDICQDVCPWNRSSRSTTNSLFAPIAGRNPIELAPLFTLDDDAFRQQFRTTPLWRPKRRGILRNAAIVLGNQPAPQSVGALLRGLHDDELVVRAASAWALGRQAVDAARAALEARRVVESAADVVEEIDAALDRTDQHGRP